MKNEEIIAGKNYKNIAAYKIPNEEEKKTMVCFSFLCSGF